MKKKIELNKKTIKRLKLKLQQQNDRKVAPDLIAPAFDDGGGEFIPTNGGGCTTSHPPSACW